MALDGTPPGPDVPLSPRAPAWLACRSLYPLGLLFVFQLAVGAAVINYFRRTFGFSPRLIPVHLLVVAGLFVLSTIGPAFLLTRRPLKRLRPGRFAFALPPALTFAVVALLYVGAFVGTTLWGNNLNYGIVGHYVRDWSGPGAEMMLLPAWVLFAAAAFVVVMLSTYLALATSLSVALTELAAPGRRFSLFGNTRRSALSGTAFLVLLVGYASAPAAISSGRVSGSLVSADPLLGFWANTNVIYDFNRQALARKIQTEEPLVRAAYHPAAPFARRNVILVIVDSLRADHMGLYGYARPTTPFLTRLRDSGRLKQVGLATSTCAESNCGILSTLASRPLRELVPDNFKLSDLLHDQGYATHFVLSGNHDWYGLKQAYGRELTSYFDGTQSARYASADDRVIFEGLDRVPPASGMPAFFYFHLMSVHLVGVKQEAYRRYPSRVGTDWTSLFRGDYDVESVRNNYDNGVLQADATIEGIFEALDAKGYLKNSLVAIVADHGEGLGERGRYGHISALYQEYIRIPMLFVDDPGVRYANLDFATQVDVAPTILDRLGLPIPSSWRGLSLLRGEARRESFHQTTVYRQCFAVLNRDNAATYKYSYCARNRQETLFELGADPGEQRNLVPGGGPVLDRMRQRLKDELAQSE